LSGDRFSISFQIDGRPVSPKDEPSADVFISEPGYFRTMGIPLIRGRDFEVRDEHKSTPVVIVNESFAKQFFPGEEVVGRRIIPGISTWDDDDADDIREIVGVVADIRNRALNTEPKPAYYLPQGQVPFSQLIVVAKTAGDPHSMVSSITREVSNMDSELPVFGVRTMEEYISASVAGPRFNTTLLSIFAAVALVLTIIGLYGVMSYSVAQRTNEIGIRMALGAPRDTVLGMILRRGLATTSLGLAAGLGISILLARLLQNLIWGVPATDAVTFVGIPVALVTSAALAILIPARRATRIDPIIALRYE
jgi:putative ABC transport system permease protein